MQAIITPLYAKVFPDCIRLFYRLSDEVIERLRGRRCQVDEANREISVLIPTRNGGTLLDYVVEQCEKD